MPQRIQRKRTKGWKMPEGAVYVGRPTKWGNLWVIGLVDCGCRGSDDCHHNSFRCEGAAEAVEMFRRHIEDSPTQRLAGQARAELRGKDLACWCALDQPCHADVLLEIANV